MRIVDGDTARQQLRDYAREDAIVKFHHEESDTDLPVAVGPRGELAGKAFVALQNVLDLLPEISEKNGVPHVAGKIVDVIEAAFE